MSDILSLCSKLNLKSNNVYNYNSEFLKIIDYKKINSKKKLILVTATSPTPFGEGKTTISISLNDALNKLGYNSLLSLREPSLGPTFGFKGGATGGGKANIIPSDKINLHFTGDLHAIASANNLISAAIDNHIYFGNQLNIETITFKRCVDVCDRTLRKDFNITAASEIMAVFTLAKDLEDLRNKVDNIIIGYNDKNEFIYLKSLHMTGSIIALLKDAFNPNIVKTSEDNLALIHGGPFANIAHGCSSVKATKTALDLADYTITEAGFGSDLGAVKFLDIKCRLNNLKPDCIVLTTTIKALKYNGENNIALGISNLSAHIDLLSKFNIKPIVCINKYDNDNINEIKAVTNYLDKINIKYAISTGYNDGSSGSEQLAKLVIEECDTEKYISNIYDLEDILEDKIEKTFSSLYSASAIEYSSEALNMLKIIKKNNINNLPICISKTQYSISSDSKLLGYPKNNKFIIKNIEINNGAGFIVILTGSIIRMPGLSKDSNYTKIDVINNKIINLN